jgi:hypothetical protein
MRRETGCACGWIYKRAPSDPVEHQPLSLVPVPPRQPTCPKARCPISDSRALVPGKYQSLRTMLSPYSPDNLDIMQTQYRVDLPNRRRTSSLVQTSRPRYQWRAYGIFFSSSFKRWSLGQTLIMPHRQTQARLSVMEQRVELLASQVALQSQSSVVSRHASMSESLIVSVIMCIVFYSTFNTITAQRRRSGRMSAAVSHMSTQRVKATPAELAEAVRVLSAWNPTQDDTLTAQAWIQWIDSVSLSSFYGGEPWAHSPRQRLQDADSHDPSHVPLLHQLRRLCRSARRLPPTYLLDPSEITLLNHESVSSSAISDVYRGLRGGQLVAVKALRVLGEAREDIQRVRAFCLYSNARLSLICSGLLQRSRRMEVS